MIRILLLVACLFNFARAGEKESGWQSTTWNGERALVSTSPGGKAIISLERGRLVHFGPGENETNLLFAPSTRNDPVGWGGHRLWFGPQSTWPKGWPPPAAWEHSGADSFVINDGVLRVTMPEVGDGWPRLTRTYQWKGNHLVCGAELSGGTRSVQIIHILQAQGSALVDVLAESRALAPHGYVELPSLVISQFTTEFTPPPHVTSHGKNLSLRHLATVQKLGFAPQPLIAHEQSLSLTVARGAQSGTITSEPDRGFSTQVYLGGPEPFTELEQLSPAFAAGAPASFAVELEITRQ